mmetsp:Transcript_25689/g.71771  ORF Transcript_25689/g.71771 Transcript_25689/m.71771 type:complete len:205 (+) Transcript_25689:596-1210(+)
MASTATIATVAAVAAPQPVVTTTTRNNPSSSSSRRHRSRKNGAVAAPVNHLIHPTTTTTTTAPQRAVRSHSLSLPSPIKLRTTAHHKSPSFTTTTTLKENDSMIYLNGKHVYSCIHCRTHLTNHDEIISKSFHGRHGRAFLFGSCVNITLGKAEDRYLITGLHTVCDIQCKRCNTTIGWTYIKAYEEHQKYKEGKYIIEKIHFV